MATRLDHIKQHLDRLIRLPSVSSANADLDMSNLAVVEYLAECFESLGFDCQVMDCPSDSGNRKANLIATLGSGPGGLVFSGHTDTVPVDEELWTVDPFRLTEKNGRYYGLGSTDMKGFFPLVMEAVKPFDAGKLKQPLIVVATADEETSMYGARELVARKTPRANYAIIGEPTGLVPVKAHKGIMMESLRLTGRSGHSSDPSLGNNALEAMYEVIGDLMKFREELRERYRNPLFRIDYPTLNLGCIHGGDNPNRICGHCDLEFDIRLMPGMAVEETRELIKRRVQTIADSRDIKFELVPLFPGIAPFQVDSDSTTLSLAEELTGRPGETVAFGTEAPLLQELGMDTIVLGPGCIDQAHQPDEYLGLDMVDPCIDLLQRFIERVNASGISRSHALP